MGFFTLRFMDGSYVNSHPNIADEFTTLIVILFEY